MSIASVVMSPYKRLPDQEMEPLSQNPSILSSFEEVIAHRAAYQCSPSHKHLFTFTFLSRSKTLEQPLTPLFFSHTPHSVHQSPH